jgi:TolA-binding protein
MIASTQSPRGRSVRLFLLLLLPGLVTISQGGDAVENFRRGEERYQAGDWQGAAAAYAAVLADPSADTLVRQALYSQGWAIFQAGDCTQSLASFCRFLERYPADELAGECRLKIGDSLCQLGRPAEAATWYAAAESNAPAGSARAELAAAAHVLALGQAAAWPRAEAAATEFLARYPAATNQRAAILFLQGESRQRQARKAAELIRVDQAARRYEAVCAGAEAYLARYPGTPNAPRVRLYQAEALQELNRLPEALQAYGQVGACDDAAVTNGAAYGAAWVLRKLGQHAAAADAFAAVAAGRSGYAGDALFWAARSLEEAGSREAAVAAYDACLRSAPATNHAAEAAYRQAHCLWQTRQPEEALRRYQALLAEHPAGAFAAQARYDLAWLRQERGEPCEARRQFETLVQQYPRHPLAPDAAFRAGELAYAAAAFAAAATNYEAAATTQVACAEQALYKLGWTREKLGQTAAAAHAFQLLATRFPRSALAAEAWFRAGTLWQTLGRFAEARAAWAQVREGRYAEQAACGVAASWRTQGNPAEAATAYGVVLTNWPQGVSRVTARLGRAEAWRTLGQWTEALEEYRAAAAAAAAESREAAQAMLGQGHGCFALRKWEEAARCFAKVDLLFEYADLKPEALEMLARSWEQAGDATKAALYRAERRKRFPAGGGSVPP